MLRSPAARCRYWLHVAAVLAGCLAAGAVGGLGLVAALDYAAGLRVQHERALWAGPGERADLLWQEAR